MPVKRGDSHDYCEEGASSHCRVLSQVIESKQVTGLPLNGRSYTALLAIQCGVTPITYSFPAPTQYRTVLRSDV